jgi:ATP-dependent 26S proteasome regulatory subunit
MGENIQLIEPVVEQNVKDRIFNSILSEPIAYVRHNNYSYFKRVLYALIKDKDISDYLEITEKDILEYDLYRGVFTAEGEHLGNLQLGRFLSDILDRESSTIDDIQTYKIFILYGAMSTIADSKECINELVTFANEYYDRKFNNKTTIFIVENFACAALPTNLSSYVSIIDFPLPNSHTIFELVKKIPISRSILERDVHSFQNKFTCLFKGLQQAQIISILTSVLPKTGYVLSNITYELCETEKKRMIKKTNVIELVDSDVSLQDIGGLDVLKEDIRVKSVVFRNIAPATSTNINIPTPKGILILGMPGCGKSMIAKAIANEFDIPLLRLDIGRLMGKYVGESEENLRSALNTAEASHPCILWIDEVEKAFAGNNSNGNGDSLVIRLMGSFLTWMQEHRNPVYIIATANDVMRPEFMRRGRFDEVYFVNFPNQQEAEEILRNKLTRYNHKNSIFDFQRIGEDNIRDIAKNMHGGKYGGFAGAEIEAVVNSVVERAFVSYVESGCNHKILIKESEFIFFINKMRPSIMSNQSSSSDKKSNIERIFELQKAYRFKSASKE